MTYSIFGKNTTTGEVVQISQASRREGLYIIGASGTGKSTLISNLIDQDIAQGLGVCLLDPHGDLTNRVMERMTTRIDDVVLLDVANDAFPFGLNLFACPYPQDIRWVQYTVNQVMHIFDRLYDISRATPNMSYFLRNCTYTIIANPSYTMAEIPLLLTNDAFRKSLVSNVKEDRVLRFWSEYEKIVKSRWDYNNTVLPILNKLDEFLQPMLLNIVGQSKSTIDLRTIMDERKLLFVKLDPRLEDMTTLIGSVIIAQVLNAAYSRGEVLEKKRKQFNVYADEFEWFAGEDFMQLVSEARKFGIGTTVSNQTLSQIPDPIKENILQAATLVVFRVSGLDAEELAKQFDAVPPPAETRREAVLIPKQDVISHLMQHGHTNENVSEFAKEYLPKLQYAAHQQIDKSPMGLRITRLDYVRYPHVSFPEGDCYAFDPEEVRKHLMTLNTHLYNSMVLHHGKAEVLTPNEVRPNEMIKTFSAVLGFPHYYLGHCEPQRPEGIHALRKLQEIAQNPIMHLLEYGHKNQTVQDFIQHTLAVLKRDIDNLTEETVDTNSGAGGNIYIDKHTYYTSLTQLKEGFYNINHYFAAIIDKQIQPYDSKEAVALLSIIYPLRSWIGFAPGVKYEAHGIPSPISLDEHTSESLRYFLTYLLLSTSAANKGEKDTALEEALAQASHVLYLTRAYYAKTQLDPAVTRSATQEESNTWLHERGKNELNNLITFIQWIVTVAHILADEPIVIESKQWKEKPIEQWRETATEEEEATTALMRESGLLISTDLYWQLSHGLPIGEKIEIYQNRLVTYRYEGGAVTEENYPEVARDAYWREADRYRTFMQTLMNATIGLIQEPIRVESGSYEEKPLAPRTYADVEKEVAKFLASPLKLPNLTTYIKTPTGEHTVAIERSRSGMSRTALNQRLAQILGKNYNDGYLRKRAEVEEQIRKRQELPPPSQPQSALKHPPQSPAGTAPEPPPQPKQRPKIV